MHSNIRPLRPSHDSPLTFPSQPRQENLVPQHLRVVKQENVPARSPFLKLPSNRTVKQQPPSSISSHSSLYIDALQNSPTEFSVFQPNKPAPKSDHRHSLHSDVKAFASQAPRHSLPLTAAGRGEHTVNAFKVFQDQTDGYVGTDTLSEYSSRKEPVSSPLQMDADKYDRIMDTELLSQTNDQTLSGQDRASSVTSTGPPIRESSRAPDVRRSQSRTSHAHDPMEETGGDISDLLIRGVVELRSVKAELDKKVDFNHSL